MVAPFDLESLRDVAPEPEPETETAPPPLSRRERRRLSAPPSAPVAPSVEPTAPVLPIEDPFVPVVPYKDPLAPVVPSEEPPTAPPRADRRRSSRRRPRLSFPSGLRLPFRVRGWVVAIVVPVALIIAAALFVVVRLSAAIPPAVVTSTFGSSTQVHAAANVLPWPATAQSAIAVPSIGIDVPSAPETAAPIASLTKMMTAYVILHDHPLGARQQGPNITISQADLDDFNNDTVQDQANAQVIARHVRSS